MNKEEKISLAKHISEIRWTSCQADDPFENDKVHILQEELMKLPPKEAIRLLFAVMEAKECHKEWGDRFKDMLEFKYTSYIQ